MQKEILYYNTIREMKSRINGFPAIQKRRVSDYGLFASYIVRAENEKYDKVAYSESEKDIFYTKSGLSFHKIEKGMFLIFDGFTCIVTDIDKNSYVIKMHEVNAELIVKFHAKKIVYLDNKFTIPVGTNDFKRIKPFFLYDKK